MTAVMTETTLPELTMSGGLAGFPDAERYALVEVPDVDQLFLLCSLDSAGLQFVVAPPAMFFPDYAPELDDASAQRLGLENGDDALVLVLLNVASGIDTATANLLAPIVINQHTREAAQVLLQADWPLRAPLRRT